MRNMDLSHLYRSAIGFERLFSLFDGFSQSEPNSSAYPPYNIERLDENIYRISMAVAGFDESEIDVELHQNQLKVRGKKQEDDTETKEYLYRGIASRAFEHIFQIADHVEITGASLKNGLLHINLLRKLPEEIKPRKINIMDKCPESSKEAKAGV